MSVMLADAECVHFRLGYFDARFVLVGVEDCLHFESTLCFCGPNQIYHGLIVDLESTESQPVSQLYFPRFAWSSDCASMRSRGCTAVLELLATPARAIIIAADPGRRARCRGLPGGAAQEKIDVREIFGLVRFYTDDYLPV